MVSAVCLWALSVVRLPLALSPKIHPNSPFIRLGPKRQPFLSANLLHRGLDPLHVSDAMHAAAHNDVKPATHTLRARRRDARLENRGRLVDKLAVQVEHVGGETCVVGGEDERRGLHVVGGGGCLVRVSFGGEAVGSGRVVGRVCLLCLQGAHGPRCQLRGAPMCQDSKTPTS